MSAAVAEVEARGVPVFSVLSDFASGVREGYVGLNNRKVGRSAAWIISRIAKPGKAKVAYLADAMPKAAQDLAAGVGAEVASLEDIPAGR